MNLNPEKRALWQQILSRRDATAAIVNEPITPAQRPARASFAQERLWFLDRLFPGNAAYNIPVAQRIQGRFNVAALQPALTEIVRRHEILRCSFQEVQGTPVQVVTAPGQVQIAVEEVQDEDSIVSRIGCEASKPFDLTVAPLFRVTVFQVKPDEHVLLIVLHHIVCDGWSLDVLLREMWGFYGVAAGLSSFSAPSLPAQYADWAAWQRQKLQRTQEQHLEYWSRDLSGIEPLQIPVYGQPQAERSNRGAKYGFVLEAPLVGALERLAREEGATLFMASLSTFSLLLSRYTGQPDIVVGSPVAGRDPSATETLIGLFVNTLIHRTDLSGNPSFRELIRRVRDKALEAYLHQELPIEKLVQHLQPERHLSRSPLFQVMLTFQNFTRFVPDVPGLQISAYEVPLETAKLDLTLNLSPMPDGLRGTLIYSTDLFKHSAARAMAEAFCVLVDGVTSHPDRPVAEISIFNTQLRRHVLHEWNATARDYDQGTCAHELFEDHVTHRPDAVAIVFGDEHVTYLELNSRAERLAGQLRKHLDGTQTIVGIHLRRGINMMIAVLAILKAGAAFLPLDPWQPQQRLKAVLSKAEPPIVFTELAFADALPQIDGMRTIVLDDPSYVFPSEQEAFRAAVIPPESAAYVIFTSGSTGIPKGVVVEHRQIVNYARAFADRVQLSCASSFAMVQPLFVDSSETVLFGAFYNGGCLHLLAEEIATDPVLLGEYMERHDIDCLKIAPSHLAALQKAERPERFVPFKLLVVGGEASRWSWLEQVHSMKPHCAIFNHYGPTETTVGVLMFPFSEALHSRARAQSFVPMGRPVANVHAYVLTEGFEPVPIGAVGELCIGGSAVTRGYLKEPSMTADKYVPDPLSGATGGRLYRTGDLARFHPDGNLEYLGRADDQIKVHGFRVELGEIEAVIARQRGVRTCAVAARNLERLGVRLVGYVVWRPEEARDWGELERDIQRELPDHMVPSAWVGLEELPLSPQGKVHRKSLPVPKLTAAQNGAATAAPRNAVEKALATIWSQVLQVDSPGIFDNFFRLGGDSILSIQMIAQAARVGIRLTPRQIFEAQTIADLAQVVSSQTEKVSRQEVVQGEVVLSPIQRWFFDQGCDAVHHYNQSMLLEPREPLDPGPLREALRLLLFHHDALRFRFVKEAGTWRQMASDDSELLFEQLDLSAMTHEQQTEAIDEIGAERQAGLNLSSGPLVRAVLFERGPARAQRFLLIIHHLVVDGISWRILLDDLEAAYRQFSAGKKVELPEKSASFQFWNRALSEYARSSELVAELPFWTEAQREVPESFTPDGPGGPNTVASASKVLISLPAADTRALLRELPATNGISVEEALVAALAVACRRCNGGNSVQVLLEGHGREPVSSDIDVSRTVGWFTSLYPIRIDFPDVPETDAMLEATVAYLRKLPRKGIGYGILCYLSGNAQNERGLASAPEPQLSFNYLGQFDQTFGADSLFTLVSEPQGNTQSPLRRRPRPLEVNAMVLDSELRLAWTYSRHQHKHETVARLACCHRDAIAEIIACCRTRTAASLGRQPRPQVSPQEFAAVLEMINQ